MFPLLEIMTFRQQLSESLKPLQALRQDLEMHLISGYGFAIRSLNEHFAKVTVQVDEVAQRILREQDSMKKTASQGGGDDSNDNANADSTGKIDDAIMQQHLTMMEQMKNDNRKREEDMQQRIARVYSLLKQPVPNSPPPATRVANQGQNYGTLRHSNVK